jgi:hypothetical protein
MVPAITDSGRSFKGAALYYLHDKRQPDEAERLTADRVGWTQTVNLATDDPELALRIMAYTAMMQGQLKAAAGTKATGRKLTTPVLAYSLAWHPDERPTKEQKLDAARDSLKALGLEEHQAVILEHTDEPHAHVHIVVNRVHPETGKAATLSNSKLKLSQWAQEYEQKQGQILCPQRVENNARRKRGAFVHSPRIPRPVYEFRKAAGNDDLGAEFVKTQQKEKDAQLNAHARQMQTSHARQWEELKRVYGVVRGRIKDNTTRLKNTKAAEIKDQAKGRWRDLYARQREQRKTFDAAERGILSKLWSMSLVYRELRRQNRQADALTIFYTLMSSSQRRAVFDQAQEGERRDLARKIRQQIGAASRAIDHEARRDFDKLRNQYLGQCGQLRQTQDRQKAELKAAWQTRNAERKEALGPIRERAPRMRQARHHRRGRSIKDDDLFRRPPRKPDPGQGGPS